MKWFWDAYAPDVSVRSQPTASPLRTSLEELGGLPPALLITAENDVLRDEGEAYAHRLMQAGVKVTAVRYMGTIHDFLLLNPIAGTTPPEARSPRSPTPCGACSSSSGSRRPQHDPTTVACEQIALSQPLHGWPSYRSRHRYSLPA